MKKMLTKEEIQEIKDIWTKKELDQYQLAEKYNVTRNTIRKVIKGEIW